MVVWGVSVDTTILHTFLSMPACAACTDNLVKVLISKQSFLNIAFGLFSKVNHIYMD